jgi:hypothetical protein
MGSLLGCDFDNHAQSPLFRSPDLFEHPERFQIAVL